MAERSIELITVGYYLSRFGSINPPSSLHVKNWKEAYALFIKNLVKNVMFCNLNIALRIQETGLMVILKLLKERGGK